MSAWESVRFVVISPSLLKTVKWEICFHIKWSRKGGEGFLRNLENMMTHAFSRNSKMFGCHFMQHFCMISLKKGSGCHWLGDDFTFSRDQWSREIKTEIGCFKVGGDDGYPWGITFSLSYCWTCQQEESVLKTAVPPCAVYNPWRENVGFLSSAFLQSHSWAWRSSHFALITPA